ncbi:hypothetical protein ZHAS_00018164 [Anopheles sinensis]|uniref:Uncharacterized protein n=1 Tax=Anopheles sinensis TaxID=74873 RepID=A0A084WIR5_ANOSI|nr:hypothetical protein ZHAS_00018164 [Anopheles sinensis]
MPPALEERLGVCGSPTGEVRTSRRHRRSVHEARLRAAAVHRAHVCVQRFSFSSNELRPALHGQSHSVGETVRSKFLRCFPAAASVRIGTVL